MPRLTVAQLTYGTLTVVVATTVLLMTSEANTLPAVFGFTLIGLVLGAAVTLGAHWIRRSRVQHHYVHARHQPETATRDQQSLVR